MTRMSLFDSAEDLQLNELAVAAEESEKLFYAMIGMEDGDDHQAPSYKMWSGYETALAGYATACYAVLVSHGIHSGVRSARMAQAVAQLRQAGDPAPLVLPPWVSDTAVLKSHRSNLMRRFPDSYSWKGTPARMPYVWPFVDEDGGYTLNLSKHDKQLLADGERALPKDIERMINNL